MKSRDLIESLVSILGLYELIQGLAFATYLIPFDGNAEEWPPLSTAASAAVLLVLGTSLIAMRGWLADRLASASEPTLTTPGTLMETLLAIVGVYFVVIALASGAAIATGDYLRADFMRELSGQPVQSYEIWPPRIRVVVQLVLGLGLAVGRSGIAAALTSLRSAGKQRTSV